MNGSKIMLDRFSEVLEIFLEIATISQMNELNTYIKKTKAALKNLVFIQ